MINMKVAVSLPDPVFHAAEELAQRLKTPRSRLYAQAIEEFLDARSAHSVTERLNAVYVKEKAKLDPMLASAQLKSLNDEAW